MWFSCCSALGINAKTSIARLIHGSVLFGRVSRLKSNMNLVIRSPPFLDWNCVWNCLKWALLCINPARPVPGIVPGCPFEVADGEQTNPSINERSNICNSRTRTHSRSTLLSMFSSLKTSPSSDVCMFSTTENRILTTYDHLPCPLNIWPRVAKCRVRLFRINEKCFVMPLLGLYVWFDRSGDLGENTVSKVLESPVSIYPKRQLKIIYVKTSELA